MATLEGEERLMIVFADVHYYFNVPGPKPSAHRFEKGSYLYLYGNKTGSGARLEIANNAGTPEQDAFTGSLDTATIRQSFKQPTLCTITAKGYHDQRSASPRLKHYWSLPMVEPYTDRIIPQYLHTVDVYFWTAQDADSFIRNASRLLQHDQVQLLDVPPSQASRDKVVSPVVQQLENVAVQDSARQEGKATASSEAQVTQGRQEAPKVAGSASFQPLAYNPAAPPAPELIRHREKTPPPIDAEAGTGLGAAAHADQVPAAQQSSMSRPSYGQMPQSQGYVPQAASQIPTAVSPLSTPSAGGQRPSSVFSLPPPPPLSPPNKETPLNQQLVPSLNPLPQRQDGFQHDQNGNPLPSPASQVLGNTYVGSTHQPMQHVQPQYADYLGSTSHQTPGPIEGYSNYTYTQERHQHAQGGDYDVHSQVYRPTEAEAKRDPRHKTSEVAQSQQPGKLDQQANRVDKGVNRLFKRLEKRIG